MFTVLPPENCRGCDYERVRPVGPCNACASSTCSERAPCGQWISVMECYACYEQKGECCRFLDAAERRRKAGDPR